MRTKVASRPLFVMTLSLGMLVSAAPAEAAASVVSVGDGTILARNAVVQGTYTVECDFPDEQITVDMQLTQRRGGKTVTSATFSDIFVCGGEKVSVTRTYDLTTFRSVFKAGSAEVTGIIYAGTASTYSEKYFSEDIQVIRSR